MTTWQKLACTGRKLSKIEEVKNRLSDLNAKGSIESYQADLSDLSAANDLAEAITKKHDKIDVLINNAGIFKTPKPITADGLDVQLGGSRPGDDRGSAA